MSPGRRFAVGSLVVAILAMSHAGSGRTAGWPDRPTSFQEAEALDALAAAGATAVGYYSSHAIHVAFPGQCRALRPRSGYYVLCGVSLISWLARPRQNVRATDADLRHLTAVPSIVGLDLCGTAVTDGAVATIRQMQGLRYINVYGTSLTPHGITALARTMPDTEIRTTDPVGFVE